MVTTDQCQRSLQRRGQRGVPGRPDGVAAVVGLVGLCCAAAPALAAEFSFVPKAAVTTVYSDNITFAQEGEETQDFAGVIAPGFELRRDDQRLSAALDYTLQAVGYLETDDANQIFHQVDAALNAALVPDHLFVDVSGLLFQQVADPESPIIQNPITRTGNRTNTWQSEVGVTWLQSLGDFAQLDANYRYGVLDFEEPQLLDSTFDGGRFNLTSPLQQEGFNWALRGEFDRIRYEVGIPDAQFSRIFAELGYWAGTNLRLFVTGGAESDFTVHRDRIEYDVAIWSVGVDWSVASRDQLTASFGRRVFGQNFNFSWSHTLTDVLSFTLSYTERPSVNALTARQQPPNQFPPDLLPPGQTPPGQLPPGQRPPGETNPGGQVGLNRPGDGDLFIIRRLSSGFSVQGNRVTIRLSAYAEDRSDRIVILEGQEAQRDETAYGGIVSVNWPFGVRTSFLGTANVERAQFASGIDTERLNLLAGLNYELGRRTNVRLDLQRFQGSNDEIDFTENRISLSLARRFE
jgi:uncharacterized protein (PEP-CTERM system associated)